MYLNGYIYILHRVLYILMYRSKFSFKSYPIYLYQGLIYTIWFLIQALYLNLYLYMAVEYNFYASSRDDARSSGVEVAGLILG